MFSAVLHYKERSFIGFTSDSLSFWLPSKIHINHSGGFLNPQRQIFTQPGLFFIVNVCLLWLTVTTITRMNRYLVLLQVNAASERNGILEALRNPGFKEARDALQTIRQILGKG